MASKAGGIRRRSNSDSELLGGGSSLSMKKVVFDEIIVREFPIILGDHPAVSSGAPITIGWKPINESVIDLDFYEYCRVPERKSRKKMILSVRRRANVLLSAGYSLEEIGSATLDVEKTKKMRADSLRASGFGNPWELLSGAVETTGAALKRADVLGVGYAAGTVIAAGGAVGGAVVGAGAAVGGAANTAVRASVTGVGTVLGAGANATVRTGQFLASGVGQSSRAVMDGGHRYVAKPMVGAGKAVAKPVGNVVKGVVTGTGRVLSTVVSPLTGGMVGGAASPPAKAGSSMASTPSPSSSGGATPQSDPPRLKRRTSLPMPTQ